MVKLIAFSGSARKDSYNKKLLAVAVQGAREAGAEVTVVDLNEYNLPIFNEDFESEQGIPEQAQLFKELLINCDGFIITSPEYNSSYSALLKNAIDWASRAAEGEKPMAAFRGKMAAIMATSPGALGGIRGLVPLRMLLENIGTMVLPTQQAIGKAQAQFNEDGTMTNSKKSDAVKAIAAELVQKLTKLA